MPQMGKTEEDWNGLKLGFLKTVQSNSFWKLIPAACNFKNNAQETYRRICLSRIKGIKGGAVVRALASQQGGPGSDPGFNAICGLSLLLVLSFAPRGFSPGTPVFPSPQKPTFPNSNLTRNQVDEEPPCGCATCKLLFIYLFYFILSFTCNFFTYFKIQRLSGQVIKYWQK